MYNVTGKPGLRGPVGYRGPAGEPGIQGSSGEPGTIGLSFKGEPGEDGNFIYHLKG